MEGRGSSGRERVRRRAKQTGKLLMAHKSATPETERRGDGDLCHAGDAEEGGRGTA